jgi:putative transposase
MPRAARVLADNEVYHVLNRGNGRSDVFHTPEDFQAFVNLIAKAKERYPVKVIAYCLMSNHFHLLVKPERGEDLSKWMQWLMTSHVRRYHRRHGTSGHIWQGRFKSFLVKDDDQLLTVARYVEGNPVQAGMVTSAKEWPWSSHRDNLGTGSASAVPVPIEKPVEKGQALAEPVHVTDIGMYELPADWSAYVDTPLTGRELNRLKICLDRQVPF